MKNREWIKIIVGVVAGSMAVFGIYTLTSTQLLAKQSYYNKQKVTVLGQVLGKNYIEEAPEEEMLEGIYRGYVASLGDVKTGYLTEEEFIKMQVELAGDYIGTGIEFVWGITGQYIVVTNVIENSPADLAGIEIGDRVTALDGVLVMLMNQEQIYEKLLYTGEQAVVYSVESKDGEDKGDITLISDVVPIQMTQSYMETNSIGYIEIHTVATGTSEQVKKDIESLKQEGATSFIIDVRGMTTNNIDEVVALIDLFIGDEVAFYVEDKELKHETYTLTSEGIDEPIVILTNMGTSGAMEGFVGAMKAYERAHIVGNTTAGDGSVQELIPLGDGSGLSVTAGYIVTPDGIRIKDNGIEPTYEVSNSVDYTLELVTRGEVDSKKDTQLQEAIFILE